MMAGFKMFDKRLSLACCLLFSALFSVDASASDARVILLGGQSNMQGLGNTSDLGGDLASPLPAVQIWSGSSYSDLASGFGIDFGPELQFGHALADALPGQEIYLIKYAASGTNLENDWNPATGPQYTTFKKRVASALGNLDSNGISYSIEAMLWTQGERDARVGFGSTYEANLNAFIADVRSEYGSDLPFLVSQLSENQTDVSETGLGLVRTAQASVAANDSHTYLINTDTFGLLSDDLHFNTSGQLDLGQAFADEYLAIAAPEPGSLMLLGVGGLYVLLRRRRA